MPVLQKEKLNKLNSELSERFAILKDCLKQRDLKSCYEGCTKGRKYANPELFSATSGTGLQISLAVEDFKAILSEIKKIKD